MRPRSFEEKLRERTDDFSLEPKPGSWENIESQLPPVKSRKRSVFWLAGTLALLVGASIGIRHLAHESKQQSDIAANAAVGKGRTTPSAPGTTVHESELGHTPVGHQSPVYQNTSSALPGMSGTKKPVTVTSKIFPLSVPNSSVGKPRPMATENLPGSNPASVLSSAHDADGIAGPQPQPSTASDSISTKHENIASSIATDNTPVKKPGHGDTALEKKEEHNLRDYLGKRLARQVLFSELVFQPVLSGSFITIDKKYKDQNTYKDQETDRKQNDKGVWTYGIGLQAGLEKKRWIVAVGVFYQRLSYQVAVQNINSSIISGNVSNKSFDYNATDSFALGNFSAPNRIAGAPRVIEGGRDYVTNTFEYLSVPLSLTYKLKYKGRFNIGLSASVMPQFLLSYQGLLYQEESGLYVKQKSARENHVMPRNLALAGGLELSYHLAKHSNLFARPQCGASLYPAEKTTVRTYMRFKALSLGYRFYF